MRTPVDSCTNANKSSLPFSRKFISNSTLESKWSSMARLLLPVTIRISSMPDAMASSTMNWMVGLSTIGNISFAMAFVAGKKRVPNPAAGITAFLTFFMNTFAPLGLIRSIYPNTQIFKLGLCWFQNTSFYYSNSFLNFTTFTLK